MKTMVKMLRGTPELPFAFELRFAAHKQKGRASHTATAIHSTLAFHGEHQGVVDCSCGGSFNMSPIDLLARFAAGPPRTIRQRPGPPSS